MIRSGIDAIHCGLEVLYKTIFVKAVPFIFEKLLKNKEKHEKTGHF